MNPLTLIFASPSKIWFERHLESVIRWSAASDANYAKLFKKYVQYEHQESKKLLDFYAEVLKGEKTVIAKSLKGPCFGICATLAYLHLEKKLSLQDLINKKEEILTKAFFFSLFDLVRAKVETLALPPQDFETIQKECNVLEKWETHVYQIGTNPKGAASQLLNLLHDVKGTCVLLRVWSKLSYREALFIKNAHSVAPHCLFLCYDPQGCYFYDSTLKAFVSAKTQKDLNVLFLDYIQKVRPQYLSRHIFWRFDISHDSSLP